MESTSPFLAMQRTESQLKAILRGVDLDLLELSERKIVSSLRRLAIESRIDIRDYELSETREEQLKCASKAKRELTRLQTAISAAVTVFGPADAAHLLAQLGQIESWIR